VAAGINNGMAAWRKQRGNQHKRISMARQSMRGSNNRKRENGVMAKRHVNSGMKKIMA